MQSEIFLLSFTKYREEKKMIVLYYKKKNKTHSGSGGLKRLPLELRCYVEMVSQSRSTFYFIHSTNLFFVYCICNLF